MEYSRILKRALEITWRYRALWLFGALIALFAGGGASSSSFNYSFDGRDLGTVPPFQMQPQVDPAAVATAILLLVLIGIALAVLFFVVGTILRYISETALMRMVDDLEETGRKHTWRNGFRLGWSQRSLRLFVIDLIFGIPVAIMFVALFFFALTPLILWATGDTTAGVLGTVATVGLFLLVILLAILIALVLSLLRPFFYRMAVLEDRGIFNSIGEGFRLVRRHLGKAVAMWLLLVAIQIAWGIAMIPVVFVVVVIGLLIGGLPALAVGALVGAVTQGALPWLLAALVGVPLFLLVTGIPLLLLGGLIQVYLSTAWTLTFRELRALDRLGAGAPPPDTTPVVA